MSMPFAIMQEMWDSNDACENLREASHSDVKLLLQRQYKSESFDFSIHIAQRRGTNVN